MIKASIIMPAYNEEKRIGKTLAVYSSFFAKLKKKKQLDYELLIVINNTRDNTERIVKSYVKKDKNIRYINLPKGGKGYAVIEGFKSALLKKPDFIGFVDADMATLPADFYSLIKNIKNYDGIIASRYISGARVYPPNTFRRVIVSRIFNVLTKALLFLPYQDTQCGAKLFTASSIKDILPSLTMSEWAFDVDVLYMLKKKGYRVLEYPTVWTDKAYSKINFWKSGPKMALGLVRLRLLNSPFKRFIILYHRLFPGKR